MTDNQESDTTITESFNRLLRSLHEQTICSHETIDSSLEKLKIFSRSKDIDLNQIDKQHLNYLVKLCEEEHLEAQKCISNLILNYEAVRTDLIEPYKNCVINRLGQYLEGKYNRPPMEPVYEILYFDMRIVNLISSLCQSSRHQFCDSLVMLIWKVLELESERYSHINHTFIIETLKVLFILTLEKSIIPARDDQIVHRVLRRLFSITMSDNDVSYTKSRSTQENVTDLLIANIIHLLTNMNDEVYHQLRQEDGEKMINYLDQRLRLDPTLADLRSTVIPIINVCSYVCKCNSSIRDLFYQRIFSSTTDFEKRPEQYDTMRGRLVKLMTHVDIIVKDITSEFLYVVCGSDVEKLIAYTGLGNSVAFLSTRGLLKGDRPTRNDEISSRRNLRDDDVARVMERINPITGREERACIDITQHMTDQEKEASAVELANAITKLANLGVMRPARIDSSGKITELCPDDLKSKQE